MRGFALCASMAGLVVATTAYAADVYVAAPDESPVIEVGAPDFSWAGPYIGLQGGYDWNSAVNTSHPDEDITAAINGGLVGLYAGYNWQFGQAVVGVDASVNFDWAVGSVLSLGVPTGDTAEVDWKAFLRARFGFAVADHLLIYGTAGASYADLKPIFAGGVVQGDPAAWGWTVGAGVEFALSQHVTARLDYAYADYGSYNYPGGIVATNASHTLTGGVALKY